MYLIDWSGKMIYKSARMLEYLALPIQSLKSPIHLRVSASRLPRVPPSLRCFSRKGLALPDQSLLASLSSANERSHTSGTYLSELPHIFLDQRSRAGGSIVHISLERLRPCTTCVERLELNRHNCWVSLGSVHQFRTSITRQDLLHRTKTHVIDYI